MKRFIYTMLILTLLLGFSACSTSEGQPDEAASSEPVTKTDVVIFNDPILESMVREQMGKPEGDITLAEAAEIKNFNFDLEWQPEIPEETQIKDISAMQYFVNLEQLSFSNNAVSDLSPIAGLTHLRGLNFANNRVTDLTPLTGMTNLGGLIMYSCQASDYSPLATLVNLNTLMINYSTFSDLSVLSGMKDLFTLYIDNTLVSDLTPLANLTNLKVLKLEGSLVTDYSPIKDIYPNLTEKDFEMPQ